MQLDVYKEAPYEGLPKGREYDLCGCDEKLGLVPANRKTEDNIMNWFTAITVPIWIASAIQEFWRGNIRLGVISCCFALANAMLATLGGK